MKSLRSVLLCLAVPACEKFAPANPSAQTLIGDTEGALAIATSPIDTTITLGDWLARNPSDSVVLGLSSNPQEENLCRAAIAKSDIAGHKLTRFALFNVTPPADEKLPDDTSRIAEKVCRLRMVKFESEQMDSAAATRISDSLAAALDAKVGHQRNMKDVEQAQRTEWINVKVWQTPAMTVILAITPVDNKPRPFVRPELRPPASPFKVGKLELIVLTPRGYVNDNNYWTLRYLKTVRPIGDNIGQDLADADSAIVWAQLPAAARDLRKMLTAIRRRRSDSTATFRPEDDSALIRATRTIQDSAPHLDPARRSAAFVAGDLVRYAAVPYPSQDSNSPDHRLFESVQQILLGADVDESQSGFWFNRVWLWDAYEADSLGRAGHLAFVRMLKRGFDQSKECADGTDFYYTMIERGEADLRRGDNDPLVHFFVATAYKSIFDFSTFVPEDTTVHYPPKAEGESARLRAIEHFRAALAGLTDKQMRRDAWVMAADLMLKKAGLPLYFCAGEDD